MNFEFDAQRQVLIKYSADRRPKIIEKDTLVWRDLGPEDDS